jgi:entericidin B
VPDATGTFLTLEIIMKAIAAILMMAMVASMSIVVTGCNTVEGVGRDIERGGEKLQGEAREHKR